jgi:hypothetical protein
MSLVLTPAATPDLSADKLRNPLGKTKGLSRVVFEESYARKMSFLGGSRNTGRIAVAKGARLVVGRKDRSVGIWRVLEDEQGWEKVLEMDLRVSSDSVSRMGYSVARVFVAPVLGSMGAWVLGCLGAWCLGAWVLGVFADQRSSAPTSSPSPSRTTGIGSPCRTCTKRSSSGCLSL